MQWARQMKGSNLPITGALFVGTNGDRRGGRGRTTMDLRFSRCWVKGGFLKGRRKKGVKDGRQGVARSPGGNSFSSIPRVEGGREEVPWDLVFHASMERRYVHVKNCPPTCVAKLLHRFPLSCHLVYFTHLRSHRNTPI